MTPEERQERIDEVASSVKSAARDGQSITQHDLAALLEWQRRQAAAEAAVEASPGIRMFTLVPGGCG